MIMIFHRLPNKSMPALQNTAIAEKNTIAEKDANHRYLIKLRDKLTNNSDYPITKDSIK